MSAKEQELGRFVNSWGFKIRSKTALETIHGFSAEAKEEDQVDYSDCHMDFMDLPKCLCPSLRCIYYSCCIANFNSGVSIAEHNYNTQACFNKLTYEAYENKL
ncbi:hypothetical protein Lal_00020220 [Lupinus albus]|nr:hypothetical protein Lal_00020220 [Lupinus albus]